MKITRILVALGLALACGTALANTYQIEGSVDYHHTAGTGHSDDRFSLRADYYFTPVLTLNHPLAEAAFLERTTRVRVQSDLEFDWMTLGGDFYFPNSSFYAGAALVRRENGDSETRLLGTVGFLPVEGLLVTTSLTDKGYDPNLRAKYVTHLGGSNFVNVEAEFVERRFDNLLSVLADFYINRSWSIGAGYADNYGDELTLRTRKFFHNDFSAELTYTDTDWGRRVVLGGTLRF